MNLVYIEGVPRINRNGDLAFALGHAGSEWHPELGQSDESSLEPARCYCFSTVLPGPMVNLILPVEAFDTFQWTGECI